MDIARLRGTIEKLETVPLVEYCHCGKSRTEHRFYDDKIYDVQGYVCPGRLGGEFSLDFQASKTRQFDVKVSLLAEAMEVCGDART